MYFSMHWTQPVSLRVAAKRSAISVLRETHQGEFGLFRQQTASLVHSEHDTTHRASCLFSSCSFPRQPTRRTLGLFIRQQSEGDVVVMLWARCMVYAWNDYFSMWWERSNMGRPIKVRFISFLLMDTANHILCIVFNYHFIWHILCSPAVGVATALNHLLSGRVRNYNRHIIPASRCHQHPLFIKWYHPLV
jgi:hypothetical protein